MSLAIRSTLRLWLLGLAVLLSWPACAQQAKDSRQSSYELMTPEIQVMQANPDSNPAAFWLLDGQALWSEQHGSERKSCASCHGDAAKTMKGVAASFPKLQRGRLTSLEEQVNQCRTTHLELPSVSHESKTSLALTTYIAAQSKGMPIQIDATPAAMTQVEAGRMMFEQRMGQLNLSCAQCHDQRAGLKLGGSSIPQAHPTGYPIYRLEWQSMGSLERRLRNCMIGVRAEPFAFDSTEIKQLEAFLMWRARGMLIETPGVRP